MTHGQVAARVRKNKELHPDQFTMSVGVSIRSVSEASNSIASCASDCSVWVNEECDCVTGKPCSSY
jgi:hypothetical protein